MDPEDVKQLRMKKWLFLLQICFFITSCTPVDVSIRPGKRIEVSGKILPVNSSDALPTIPVATFGILGEEFIATDDHKLGFGVTLTSGNFNFTSLDIRNGKFALSLNPVSEEGYNENYATYHFIGAEYGPGTAVAVGNIELPRLHLLEFKVRNTSATQETLRYNLVYNNKQQFYLLDETGVRLEVPENYQGRNDSRSAGVHHSSEEILVIPLETIEGSELILSYSLGDNESQELRIPISSQMIDYVFEY